MTAAAQHLKDGFRYLAAAVVFFCVRVQPCPFFFEESVLGFFEE